MKCDDSKTEMMRDERYQLRVEFATAVHYPAPPRVVEVGIARMHCCTPKVGQHDVHLLILLQPRFRNLSMVVWILNRVSENEEE
jgi:hypothetical protein